MEQQSSFEGFAIVELFGHAREIGYVTTQYFGDKAMFRVDVPELPERVVELKRMEWVQTPEYSGYVLPGSTMKREAVPGRTRFIGPGAVYALNPCTEAAAREALETVTPRAVAPVTLIKREQKMVAASADDDGDVPI